MKIYPQKNEIVGNFKGHEAKKLDAIVVQSVKDESGKLYKELETIASLHKIPVIRAQNRYTWMQDEFVVTHDRKYFGSASRTMQKTIDDYSLDGLQLQNLGKRILIEPAGGNMIFVTNKNGQNLVLTAKSLISETLLGSEKEFGVDKIVELPYVDYHADLFLTAIGENKILVADDELMIENIQKMLAKIDFYLGLDSHGFDKTEILQIKKKLENQLVRFKYFSTKSPYANNDKKAQEILANEGFEVIKVPSRLYEFGCKPYSNIIKLTNRKLNYSNAIVFKNEDNETVLITGKSLMDEELGITKEISDKLDIGFEKAFIEALKPYIKPENIHFIVGDSEFPIHRTLYEFEGGLHCMCCEIPKL